MIDEKKLIEDIAKEKYTLFDSDSHCGCTDYNPVDAVDYESIIDVISKQPKIGEWIPCSEQLPEEESFYIVTYRFDNDEELKCHELYYGVADGEIEAGWHIDDDCERLYKPFTVIAWQSLPEAYREGTAI